MTRQLRMVWPVPKQPKEINLLPGYNLRSFCDGEENAYVQLFNKNNELGEWDLEKLKSILEDPLSPEGIYFVVWNNTPVATACALDRSGEKTKKSGELGWLAVDPAHRGKKLGIIVCRAVVNHFLEHGYKEIYLQTDHWRYAAIKTYLKLGFEPEVDGPDD